MSRDRVLQFVSPEAQLAAMHRMTQALIHAADTGTHVWVATMAYRIPPPPLPEGHTLAAADLAGPIMVGCYRCERDWTPELAAQRCPGDPEDYGRRL